jgi:hypothetical protein
MKKKEWKEYNGDVNTLDGWHEADVVEVEYRDGRKSISNEPWMFSGWNWGDTAIPWHNDIVRWRHDK